MNFKNELIKLFQNWSHQKVKSFTEITGSGSNRKYYRITGESKTAIGVYNKNKKENRAFIYLTKHFAKHNLNVPRILSSKLSIDIYLLEDLGDTTLFSYLNSKRNQNKFPDDVIVYYKKAIEELPKFQISGRVNLDFSICYPRPAFDEQSIMWDLNYFKYYFAKAFEINFDEQKLEDDFHTLTKFLLSADSNYFMYRDFNSRNIMVKNDELYFIDYQGGRKGSLQYDIASLLFDSKANIPVKLREELLDYYLTSVNQIKKINNKEFLKYYDAFVLIRLLQMLGAYGYRGLFEGKSHFIQSIPYAIKNVEYVLSKIKTKIKILELFSVLNQLIKLNEIKNFEWKKPDKLNVRINSFSYREKIPVDASGNGGGYVFDCRAVPNPGKLEEFKNLTGLDKAVKDFLDSMPEAQKFLNNVINIVSQSIENYISRDWKDLMINFGCTGGQHRSVYFAEKLAEYLRTQYDIQVKVNHSQLFKTNNN
ncbi:RNase adapter RapZ [Ignavibacteria bacterium 4148-Me]|uniref:RapZ C-terminal domain-containing protein n=1 Tax=Rosettibacter primus TaxID=3111523 RepID=UPI00336BEE28